jgi:glycosyltransferase involved in cell wall biosynthesis
MEKNIIFSVIIPHKNTPDLLNRCLSSIPRRKDIQIIVVDDNSNPDKVDFANFPGLNDPYIEIIFGKNENGRKGAGYARNLGLERSTGKWLLFADADDFFMGNAFASLFKYGDSDADIIFFKADSCYSDTYEKANRNRSNILIDNYLNKKKYSENQLRYRHLSPCGKMIRTAFIQKKNIHFEEIVAANDRMFSVLAGHQAQSINCIDLALYCITVTKGSIAHTISLENLESKYITLLHCNDFLKKAKVKHCQYSILPDLLLARKFGFSTFFKFLRLAVKYKSNPFIGISRSVSSFLYRRSEIRKNQRYYIEKI